MKELTKEISKYEKKFNLVRNLELKKLVNYSNYKNLPFQNWCNYQEGFSTQILDWFIKYLKIDIKDSVFLDPFCGSGSSLVTGKSYGLKSIGIDINPFSCLLSETKVNSYSVKDLDIIRNFSLPKYKDEKDFYKKYEFSMIKKLFSKENFNKIELLKLAINNIENTKSKNFLHTTLVCCLELCSNYKKAGNGLKKRKKINELDIFNEFNKKKLQMLSDIGLLKEKASIRVYNKNINSFNKIIEDDTIDLSFFSPPYPNCFDYFEVYKIELWLGGFIESYDELKKYRKSAITSNLNANLNQEIDIKELKELSNLLSLTLSILQKQELWNKNIPKMLSLYFYEMNYFLKSLFKKIKKNGHVGIVIGNSSYGGVPILSDLILTDLAKKSGFNVKEIIVTRNNETSSQQYDKISNLVSYIRESVIVLNK